ncbi:hypothetical protein [Streptomyces sp. BBFR109]|uniref:hypothetical protein n=1 Tax=Streptomyces sp. BBFR109 TaxID=3448172 RepID=UPI003F75C6C5
MHRMRRRLDGQLPVDVLATHYPDRRGHLLLNVDLGRTATKAVRRAAAANGQRPRDSLCQLLTQDIERRQRQRHRRLAAHIESLLHQHTPEAVLSYAADLLRRRPPSAAAH